MKLNEMVTVIRKAPEYVVHAKEIHELLMMKVNKKNVRNLVELVNELNLKFEKERNR